MMPSGCYRKIGAIHFFEVELYEIEKPFAQQEVPKPIETTRIEGIPLTEEWLLKFGFKEGSTYDFGLSLKRVPDYSINDFRIMLSNSVYHYIRKAWDGGSSEENESITEIKYVHQLQNLFFALTGTELELSAKEAPLPEQPENK
jgi:hypothetical protein